MRPTTNQVDESTLEIWSSAESHAFSIEDTSAESPPYSENACARSTRYLSAAARGMIIRRLPLWP